MRVWVALLGLIVFVAAGTAWLRFEASRRGGGGTPALGEPVSRFQLPDLVHNRTFSLADDFGKREVVIVSYMGWF